MSDFQIRNIRLGLGIDKEVIYADLYEGERRLICATLEHIQYRLPEILQNRKEANQNEA